MLKAFLQVLMLSGLLLPSAALRTAPAARKKPTKKLAILGKKQIHLAQKIHFYSWRVRLGSYPVLRAIAKILRAHPALRVRIESHSDAWGHWRWNQRHTQVRANTIKRLLVKAGIKAHRLEAVGLGESRPIASNRTPEGRDKNRRIELHLIPPKKRPPRARP